MPAPCSHSIHEDRPVAARAVLCTGLSMRAAPQLLAALAAAAAGGGNEGGPRRAVPAPVARADEGEFSDDDEPGGGPARTAARRGQAMLSEAQLHDVRDVWSLSPQPARAALALGGHASGARARSRAALLGGVSRPVPQAGRATQPARRRNPVQSARHRLNDNRDGQEPRAARDGGPGRPDRRGGRRGIGGARPRGDRAVDPAHDLNREPPTAAPQGREL
mmetsp:Transcript_44074/g.103463  ORF Transcript_44074/g.103463 Transcript_44074/m.103463 type:complete len:220 (-) Transcript_44074:3276-3935(-)